MATNWHPSNGFKPLVMRFFISALYTSMARYPMRDREVINISLRIIKRCGVYSEEYKN
jgi:hypothetical protein